MRHQLHLMMLFAAAMTLAVVGPAVQARHPERGQMSTVQRLAGQLNADSAMLNQTARAQRQHFTGREAEALARFAEFQRATDRFYRQTTRYLQDPAQTEADYANLREAYRRARHYFGAIHDTAPVQLAIQRTRNSMRRLVDYYQGETAAPPPPGGYGFDIRTIERTAYRIERMANRLEEQAEEQHKRDRVRDEDVKRFDRINDAAKEFYKQTVKYRGDPGHIDEEYVKLVDRMRDARRSADKFSREFQEEYGALWGQVRILEFLAPEAVIGPPPFGRREYPSRGRGLESGGWRLGE